MVGCDVYDDGDERPLPVRLGDDPVGEQTAGRLVLADRSVPAGSGDTNNITVSYMAHIGCKVTYPPNKKKSCFFQN